VSSAKRRTRTQVAQEIVIAVIVFVRKARAAGHVNTITEILLWEIAQERGYGEDEFSIRTVKRLARQDAQRMGEEHLIDF
jgi:hypothetical protein